MNLKSNFTGILFAFLLTSVLPVNALAQSTVEALSYMKLISKQYEKIRNETWDYTSSIAHSKSARKVERSRVDLLKTINNASQEVKKMSAFNGEYNLRDSVVSFLTLYFNVLNNDFDKVINLEEIAEQSYDSMEAYLLAQEKANERLNIASERMDVQYRAFADKYKVTIIESNDATSKKLKKSSEALNYYNKVYLVFFKAYRQEIYLLDAIGKSDINSIEQNRNALTTFSSEGVNKLSQIGHFKGDNSIIMSCQRMLGFYKDEAETKTPIIADFLLATKDYNEMVALYGSKDRMLLTNEEVNKYNKAIGSYKKGIARYNTTNNGLYTKRKSYLDLWNNTVTSFMTRYIPKK